MIDVNTPTNESNNGNNSRISVVIPCYKQAIYLAETLKSLLKQTYQPGKELWLMISLLITLNR